MLKKGVKKSIDGDIDKKKTKIVMILLVVILLGTLVLTTSVVVLNTTNLPNIIVEEPENPGSATVALTILNPEDTSP